MSGPTPHPSCCGAVVNSGEFKFRTGLTVSKSLRTTICITSGTGFGTVAALVSTGASSGWLVVDITDLDKPLVTRK